MRLVLGFSASLIAAATLSAASVGSASTPRRAETSVSTRGAIAVSERKSCASYSGERVYSWMWDEATRLGEIVVTPANAGSNARPLCSFTSSAMQSLDIGGIATDQNQHLWYADWYNTNEGVLSVYAAFANGNVSPIQRITGNRTLLVPSPAEFVQQIAVSADDTVWVPNWWGYNGSYGYVTAYANDANGNVKPITTIGYGDKAYRSISGLPFRSRSTMPETYTLRNTVCPDKS